MQRSQSTRRVLAAAVSAMFVVGAMPSYSFTVTVNGTAASSCQSPIIDGQGNITINCSTSTNPVCTVSASPTSLPASGGSVTVTASNCGTITSWTKSGSSVGQ